MEPAPSGGGSLGDRWFFIVGLEKNDRVTVDARELAARQRIAAVLLALDTNLFDHPLAEGELMAICHQEKPFTTRDWD